MIVSQLIKYATNKLNQAEQSLKILRDNHELNSWYILSYATKKDLSFLKAHSKEFRVSNPETNLFYKLLERLMLSEPLSYILGTQDFLDIKLKISRATLVPRPETEDMVDKLISFIENNKINDFKLLDLGCGCGAIGLSIAKRFPQALVYGVEVEKDALDLTLYNMKLNNIANFNSFLGSWFEPIDKLEKFDFIVSNPPYVSSDSPYLKYLKYEPQKALISKDNGIYDLKTIIYQSYDFLFSNSYIILEHGYDQQTIVCELLQRRGFCSIEPYQDVYGNPRFCIAIKP